MVTKKNILILSGVVSVILLILDRIGTYALCGGGEYSFCINKVADLFVLFLPSLPLFILSSLVYFLREEIFRTWIKFALVWVPLTMFLTLISPEYSQSLLPIVKGTVSFVFSALFFIISLIIITWKYFATRRK